MYDEDTTMYYLQTRYYDPTTGRFINADDTAFISSSGTAIGDNIYTYCENNPINRSDREGTFFKEIYNKLKKFGELSNEEILIQIKNSSIQKRDKNIHTEKKTKDKIFKSTDVVKILKQIKSGELSIEDAIETFK